MHTSSSNGLMVSTIETNVSSDRAHTDSVQEQNSASDFTSTPNAHEGQTPTLDASQELRLGPRTQNGFKEAKQSSKKSRMDMKSQTDSSIKDTEQSGNQQTLPFCSKYFREGNSRAITGDKRAESFNIVSTTFRE